MKTIRSTSTLKKTYPGQIWQQRAFITLDFVAETISAGYDPEIGNAVPARVYYGKAIRSRIEPCSARRANALMRLIAPLAEDLAAEYSEKWNGNNMIGAFTERGHDLIDKIRTELQEEDHIFATR